MKNTVLTLLVFFSLSTYSQNIELIAGVNKNSLYDIGDNGYHYSSKYNSDFGYSVGLGIDNIKIGWLPLRFAVRYDSYNSELEVSDGGLGGSNTTYATFDKSLITLGLFPVNFRIVDRIDINLGFEVAGLLSEQFSGFENQTQLGQPSNNIDLKSKFDKFSAKTFYGISSRIAYDIKINKTCAISPQYFYYLGLSNEFVQFPYKTKSMRHFVGIGIQKKF